MVCDVCGSISDEKRLKCIARRGAIKPGGVVQYQVFKMWQGWIGSPRLSATSQAREVAIVMVLLLQWCVRCAPGRSDLRLSERKRHKCMLW